MDQTQACHPGKRRLRFLGSIACWMRRFTWPPTLSTVPSSTPFSFSCSRSNTRSATLLKLWLSLHKHIHTQSLRFEAFFTAEKHYIINLTVRNTSSHWRKGNMCVHKLCFHLKPLFKWVDVDCILFFLITTLYCHTKVKYCNYSYSQILSVGRS